MTDTPLRLVPPIVVLTHLPSPYQVELFNEVESQRPGALRVYYLFRHDDSRNWGRIPITHSHAFLDEPGVIEFAHRDVARSPFVVFNYYNTARAAALIRARADTGRRWSFWGERPGYRYPMLSRIARCSRLGPLRASSGPIWGIGSWAVEAYRLEFGASRCYLNLPYFSDLDRFQDGHSTAFSGDVRFLFSGSLSQRKGIDLLSRAFAKLAPEYPRARLTIMGTGPLESKARAILASCASQVDWLGFKDWGELPAVYASAHVLCAPSRHDGWGLVVVEGLATGLPVIGTNRTGAALDLIEPGVNGWRVLAGNEPALLDVMRVAASLRPDQWLEMSRQARASVAEHSLANGARRFLSAVDEAARNP